MAIWDHLQNFRYGATIKMLLMQEVPFKFSTAHQYHTHTSLSDQKNSPLQNKSQALLLLGVKMQMKYPLKAISYTC